MGTREFHLPDLGEGLEDAEVVRWLVSEGDDVELNQPMVEVDTAKAMVEIPCPFQGKVTKLHADPGDTVKVGAVLVSFEVEGEESSRTSVLVGYGVDEGSKISRRRRLTRRGPAEERAESKAASSSVSAAPPVRKLASDLGIDIGSIRGTGPGGRITREDVLAASSDGAASSSTLAEERIPIKGVRKVIAEKMARSASEIPHVTTYLTIDCGEILAVKEEIQEGAGVKVTALPILARAFLQVCKDHPKLNASFDGARGEIVLKKYYHLGIATDTERGLIVPVVRDADRMNLLDLVREISRLSVAARDGTARVEELSGSTVTISNVGSFRAEYGTPIINVPEAAILAFGLIEDRPVVREGNIVARPVSILSLSFDHRVADGAEAGRALSDLKDLVENGEKLRALVD